MLGNLQKRFFTRSKDHFTKCGWTKATLVEALEKKRKEKAEKFHVSKTKKEAARKAALGDKSVATFSAELKKYGF